MRYGMRFSGSSKKENSLMPQLASKLVILRAALFRASNFPHSTGLSN